MNQNLRSQLTGVNGEWLRICGESTTLPQQNSFHVRVSTDPTPRRRNTNLTGLSLSDNPNVLQAETIFRDGRLLLAQERFLNAPAELQANLNTNYPQRFYAPTSQPYEQLDLLINGDEFIIPTGGLSSSNSQCEYDWDIYINNNYWKTYRGYSGIKSSGIKVTKPNTDIKIRDNVSLYRDQDIADIRQNFNVNVPIKAPHGYRILAFYVQETSAGAFNKCVLGTPSGVQITSELDKLKISYTPNIKPTTEKVHIPRIWQYVATCPQGNNLTRADIKTYLLYLSVPDLWSKIIDINSLLGDNNTIINFAANVIKEQISIPCASFKWIMPIAGFAKCYQTYIPRSQMLITIRPNAKYPPQTAWLRGFGFTPTSESIEPWNSQINKNRLIGVSGILTPEMACDNKSATGHNTFRSWFDSCAYLEQADLVFHHSWHNIKTCGDYFGYRMFVNCARLKCFNPNWSEPTGFETVGNYHNCSKYLNCQSLQNISESYKETYNLHEAGIGFGSYQFSGCTNLITVSPWYTEPKEWTNTPPAINSYKFENCTNLIDFIQYTETKIPSSKPSAYLAEKFNGCELIDKISPFYKKGYE
jgi:hypothetical protein